MGFVAQNCGRIPARPWAGCNRVECRLTPPLSVYFLLFMAYLHVFDASRCREHGFPHCPLEARGNAALHPALYELARAPWRVSFDSIGFYWNRYGFHSFRRGNRFEAADIVMCTLEVTTMSFSKAGDVVIVLLLLLLQVL